MLDTTIPQIVRDCLVIGLFSCFLEFIVRIQAHFLFGTIFHGPAVMLSYGLNITM